MEKIKRNHGITMISLIVSIIVLLLLAGISLSILADNNSVLVKTGEAKEAAEIAGEKQRLQMVYQAVVVRVLPTEGGVSAVELDKIYDIFVNEVGVQNLSDEVTMNSATRGQNPIELTFKKSNRTWQIHIGNDNTVRLK